MGLLGKAALVGVLVSGGRAFLRAREKREDAARVPSAPSWPPLGTSTPSGTPSGTTSATLPEPEVDVSVAMGPDVQPVRGESDGALPLSTVETHEGEGAEEHAGDRSRQPAVATPDWAPDPIDT